MILVVAAGLYLIQGVREETPLASEEVASVQGSDHDWTNCNVVSVPLEIQMEVQNVIENQGGAQEKGGLVEVLLDVKPLLEARELSWHLELPAGVKTYSGPSNWTGSVAAEEGASFVVTLSVPDGKEYYVDAVGEYEAVTGAAVRKAVTLKLDLGEAEPPANPSFIRVDETGRKVVTYRGNTIGGGN